MLDERGPQKRHKGIKQAVANCSIDAVKPDAVEQAHQMKHIALRIGFQHIHPLLKIAAAELYI